MGRTALPRRPKEASVSSQHSKGHAIARQRGAHTLAHSVSLGPGASLAETWGPLGPFKDYRERRQMGDL